MKTKTRNIIFTAAFISVWGTLAAINLIKPDTEFSENENRKLAKAPDFSVETLIDGSFMTKADTYLNDQFILRDDWIAAMSVSEFILGKRESNGVFVGNNALFNIISPSEEIAARNATGINSFAEYSGLSCYFALIPSAAGVQTDKLPLFAQATDENALIAGLYSQCKASSVPVLDTLSEHSNEYIYYRTDHHWTTYGAYLGYTEICKAAGIAPAEYNAITVSDCFNGTLYSRSGVRFVQSDTMEAFVCENAVMNVISGETEKTHDGVYFSEYLDEKDKYSYFLGQNEPVITVRGECENGRRLLLFRDSFAACITPMLLSNYSEITLIDMRYINVGLEEFIDISDYDAALFLYSTDVFAATQVTSKLINQGG